MVKPKHWNVAQQRVLRTLLVLVEHGTKGLSPGKVAELVGTIPSNATRDLANLSIAGLAEQHAGCWFSTGRLVAPSSRHELPPESPEAT